MRHRYAIRDDEYGMTTAHVGVYKLYTVYDSPQLPNSLSSTSQVFAQAPQLPHMCSCASSITAGGAACRGIYVISRASRLSAIFLWFFTNIDFTLHPYTLIDFYVLQQ